MLAGVLGGRAQATLPASPSSARPLPDGATTFWTITTCAARLQSLLRRWMDAVAFLAREGPPAVHGIPQTGSTEDRLLLVQAYAQGGEPCARSTRSTTSTGWCSDLPEALIGDRLLATVAPTPRFALVFRDDASALFVRREGAMAPVAARFRLPLVPASDDRLPVRARPCGCATRARFPRSTRS